MTLPGNKEWGIRSKLWLEVEGQPVIGEGRMEMLQAIHRHGSIIHASREIGISYRRVRGAIREMESILECPLVQAYRGGGEGGGARLTQTAYALMASYRRLTRGFHQEMDNLFLKALE